MGLITGNFSFDKGYKALFVVILHECHSNILVSGLSDVAGCRRKLPPTWLVSAGYSAAAWHFFINGVF